MSSVKYNPGSDSKDVNGFSGGGDATVQIDDGKVENNEPDTLCSDMRRMITPFVMSFGFRLFGLLLIFVDIIFVIVDLALPTRSKELGDTISGISVSISIFFLVDVLLRIFVEGSRVFNFFRALRIIILVRIIRLASQKKHLEKATRRMVSENKRRYQKDGFDLDLTYITDRVIAMSFPSSGKQSFYRNPIKEVSRFLDTKHANHYKVYNLCSEKGYDPKYFHYRVERVFIDDHNVPVLEDMLKFTEDVRQWMAADPQNVIAIHCKGGKGRTGTMICTWLIDSDQFENAKTSLDYFGERRTDKSASSKFQGVETPSQSRYVGYYEIMKNKYSRQLPPEKKVKIKSIRVHAITGVGRSNGSDLSVQIFMKKQLVFQCACATLDNCKLFFDAENDAAVIGLENCPVLSGDIKVRFESSAGLPKGYDDCPFYFWFNTGFIDGNRLFLAREQLDNPHKSKTWKIFKENFAVELSFVDA
ncbi:phosphatidylinositol 3,4,5-trisphosphate 3-phosphatase TPTE2-like [Protopterus annectens]|uniref:phosphatidylinositol 3,4,5-trisphosphate 3-phosphatase TPTE2-like n=1 Tax=Protopterus annectens TaxID=7888 RepID=UPI001CF97B2D|nr:phosphatidylinositol 3,4,5-trisphosphate 3-phosphatase TPTE2-like [Protopterus annectens]